jgi:hypothetical protein
MAQLTEHQHQVAFVQWFRLQYPSVLIYAIPNGGKRNIGTARRLKADGTVPGIPDLHAPMLGLWIEMKVEKGGYLSQPQKEIIAYLKAHGNTVVVGRGFDDAKAQVQKFMRECGY